MSQDKPPALPILWLFSICRAMLSDGTPLDQYFNEQAASGPWQFSSDAMFARDTFIVLCEDTEPFLVI